MVSSIKYHLVHNDKNATVPKQGRALRLATGLRTDVLAQAANKVFEVNELLEAILLDLPFSKKFFVKVVCKTWKELVDSSPRLRRAMFLAPYDGIIHRLEGVDDMRLVNGPMALNVTVFEPLPIFITTEWAVRYEECIPHTWEHLTFEYPPFNLPEAVMNHQFFWEVDEGKVLTVPSACRDMYLTQPPVAAVTLELTGGGTVGPGHHGLATIVDKDGITIGLVADMISKALQQLPTSMKQRIRARLGSLYARVSFRMPKAASKVALEDAK